MKKIFVLSAALAALVVFSRAASAFTMAELENGVKKYVQALNRWARIICRAFTACRTSKTERYTS
jgi:hypothetical protein